MCASRGKVLTLALGRAWSQGAGPGDSVVTVDLDSTICPVSGKTKGGRRVRLHQGVGLSVAVGVPGRHGGGGRCPSAGRVVAAGCGPFRERNHWACTTGRGLGPGERASGFGVLVLCHVGRFRRSGVGCSITSQVNNKVRALIADIGEDAWTSIGYPPDG